MITLINADDIFTLYNGDIEEPELGILLAHVFKKGIKLFSQSIKAYYMLCVHEDVICHYC